MVYIKGIEGYRNLEISIVNLQGQVVINTANSLEISVEGVEAGVYFININCDGRQIVKKIVVE